MVICDRIKNFFPSILQNWTHFAEKAFFSSSSWLKPATIWILFFLKYESAFENIMIRTYHFVEITQHEDNNSSDLLNTIMWFEKDESLLCHSNIFLLGVEHFPYIYIRVIRNKFELINTELLTISAKICDKITYFSYVNTCKNALFQFRCIKQKISNLG